MACRSTSSRSRRTRAWRPGRRIAATTSRRFPAAPDTERWEQSAAYILDTHDAVESFVKNAGLGFAIPYFHNGQPHDYMPDFIVRLKGGDDPKGSYHPQGSYHLILETKGYDELADVKRASAERWVNAVNADGQFGRWDYRMARKVSEVREILDGRASLDIPIPR